MRPVSFSVFSVLTLPIPPWMDDTCSLRMLFVSSAHALLVFPGNDPGMLAASVGRIPGDALLGTGARGGHRIALLRVVFHVVFAVSYGCIRLETWEETALMGDGNHLMIALELRQKGMSAQLGQAIVSSPFIVECRVRSLACFLNQLISEHAFDRAIQRPGPHVDVSQAILFDLLHDLIAMFFCLRQSQQNVKDRRR
jgi:hypothetical protein